MAQALKDWIMGIAGAALLTAVAMAVSPEGRAKKAVGLVCGMITVLALLKPMASVGDGGLFEAADRYKADAEARSSQLLDLNENLTRQIIEDKCRAYILDKGKSLGMEDLDAAVAVSKGPDGVYRPTGARLKTSLSETRRGELERCIHSDLGIPLECIVWGDGHES